MFVRLFLLLTLGPLIELALLIYVSDLWGWRPTLAMVVGAGLLGGWLVRREGWRAWNRLHRDLGAGRAPADSLVNSLLTFAGGVLLILPGVLSDLLGLALVFPPTRALLRRYLGRYLRVRTTGAFAARADWPPSDEQHDRIIDVRAIDRTRGETFRSDR